MRRWPPSEEELLEVKLQRACAHRTRRLRDLRAWIAKLKRGSNQHAEISAPSQSKAAELLKGDRRSVQHARAVANNGIPELVKAVEQGKAVSTAAWRAPSARPRARGRRSNFWANCPEVAG
jgi:hypothetical protein